MIIVGNDTAVAILKLLCDYCKIEKMSKYTDFVRYQGGSYTKEERYIYGMGPRAQRMLCVRLAWN